MGCSGGPNWQRRCSTAPNLLVLDEPSTGLDPSARRDISQDLDALRRREGTSVILTTHLMEEAAGCDRVAILDRGHLVALDSPAALTSAIGGGVVMVTTHDPAGLADRIGRRFQVTADVVDGRVHIERDRAHEFVTDLVESFPGEIDAVAFGKPTLEDVFVHFTGRRLDE